MGRACVDEPQLSGHLVAVIVIAWLTTSRFACGAVRCGAVTA
jgi:hypothetical protein